MSATFAADAAIRLWGVTKGFDGALADPVFRDFSCNFPSERITCIVGPSGCGKTTLLRLIAHLDAPQAGSIEVFGMDALRARKTGRMSLALQDPGLLPWRSVAGNVRVASELRGGRANGEVEDLLRLVRLDAVQDLRPHELSSGMKQRVAFARALVGEPSLLLLDEPLANVDELARADLLVALERLWLARRPTTLMVTHSIDDAVWLAHEVVVLSGRPATIAGHVEVPFARPRAPELVDAADFRRITSSVRRLLRRD